MKRHFTDGELLEVLDGEVRQLGRWRARVHLFRCWECRARKAELEQQAHRFAQAIRNERLPGPDRVAMACERIEERMRSYDQIARPSRPVATARLRWSLAAAGLCILAGAGWASWDYTNRPVPPLPPTSQLRTETATVLTAPLASSGTTALHAATPIETPAAHPVHPVPPPVHAAKAAEVKRNPSTDIDSVEADVHYRLHRIGACMGEPVLISRQPDETLLVSAIAPPAQRRRDIDGVLDDLEKKGLVRFQATRESATPMRPEAAGDAAAGAPAALRLMESPLARDYGTTAEFAERSAHIVKLSEGIYAQAWAVNRHSAIQACAHSQRSAACWLTEAMEREHSDEIRRLLQQLDDLLAPTVGMEQTAGCVSGATKTFDTVVELTAILHRLFAPVSSEDLAGADVDRMQLRRVLRRLHCSVR